VNRRQITVLVVALSVVLSHCERTAKESRIEASLTAATIIARTTQAYSVASYADSGSLTTDVGWPWRVWHFVLHHRAADEFSTHFVRGHELTYVYASMDGWQEKIAVDATGKASITRTVRHRKTFKSEDAWSALASSAGATHGASEIVPALLLGARQPSISRLSAIRRLRDFTLMGTRCFTVSGSLEAAGIHATYTLYIDQQTYFLRRVSRVIKTQDSTSSDVIDYFPR
jgi:hypothetical protein